MSPATRRAAPNGRLTKGRGLVHRFDELLVTLPALSPLVSILKALIRPAHHL